MNQTNENALPCEIVRDLLPLYHDDVVSEVTKTAVAGHLSDCADCAVEFLKLRTELPAEETSPKKKFMDLLRTRRKYRILAAVMAAVLVCGLLTGGYFLQAQFPVVEFHEEVTIERVYRYETENEYKYFVIVTHPMYGGMRIKPEARSFDDIGADLDILRLNFTKPLISFKFGMSSRIMIIEGGYAENTDGITKIDYDLVTDGGDIVWSEEWNDIETPAYVYEYDWHYYHGGAFSLDVENNWIGIECEDGTFRYWDLDGNELDAPPATE